MRLAWAFGCAEVGARLRAMVLALMGYQSGKASPASGLLMSRFWSGNGRESPTDHRWE